MTAITLSTNPIDRKNAIETLFKEYYSEMCKSAFNILKDESAAEDVVQDIFMKLYQSRKEMTIDYPKSFFKRSATNAAIDIYRKQQKTSFVDVNEQYDLKYDEEEVEDNSALLDKVNHAIDELPPKCRTIFILKRKEGYTNKEIAEELEISVKTVENQMTKAFKFLRKVLSPVAFTLLTLNYLW